jgi:hypothetical protein
MRLPPEFPTEGRNTKSAILEGQKFLMNEASQTSLLVSCRQRMSQPDSFILLLTASHFLSSLRPLMFQHRITQLLLLVAEFIEKEDNKREKNHCRHSPQKNQRR